MASTTGTSYPSLAEDVSADVAMVGGGIAGICTAWELSSAGRSVALLEADRIVSGAPGYTAAKLSSLHSLLYGKISTSFGAEAARLYAESQQGAIEHVADVVAELGIDCDLERLPGFAYAESAEQLDQLRAEVEAAAATGLRASFVTDTGLPFPVAGAVRVEDQAQFHPRKYLLALVEDMIRRPARIFERSGAVRLDEGEPCRVTTENGSTVTAASVVVATHYPVFDRALLFTRLAPRRELVVAASISPTGTRQGSTSPRSRTRGPCARPPTATGRGC
jgi:glycine/D-amino acid oxidase-like deaminating enzyme